MELASWESGEMPCQDFLEETQNTFRNGVR